MAQFFGRSGIKLTKCLWKILGFKNIIFNSKSRYFSSQVRVKVGKKERHLNFEMSAPEPNDNLQKDQPGIALMRATNADPVDEKRIRFV